MRALIIGDCHGELPEIPKEGFEVILVVGDICGGTDEMRSTMFQASEEEKEWHEIFGEEEAKEAVENSIQEGKEILSKLNSLGVPVYIVPGNWDWTGENSDWEFLTNIGYPQMLEKFENVHDLNFARKEFGDWNFVGYGPCSGPEMPQYEDDEPDSEEEMEELRREYGEKKEKLYNLMKNSENTILLSHNTPQNTSLDEIDNPDSPVDGRHYGSVIVRDILKEFSPEYNIAGHMHEAEGREKVEETECLNTGLNTVWVLDTEVGISKYS